MVSRQVKRKLGDERVENRSNHQNGNEECCDLKAPSDSSSLIESYEQANATKPISHVCKLILRLIQDMQENDPRLPIILRATQVETKLRLPRRRIYDVFHIFQALGILKKGEGETTQLKGYIFCGDNEIPPQIKRMQETVRNLLTKQLRDRRQKTTKTIQIAVLSEINDQIAIEVEKAKLPTLWAATHKLLMSIMACGNSMQQRDIYKLDHCDGTSSKSRRYYDVLAVLTTCNIVTLDTEEKFDRSKRVVLNTSLLNTSRDFSIFEKLSTSICHHKILCNATLSCFYCMEDLPSPERNQAKFQISTYEFYSCSDHFELCLEPVESSTLQVHDLYPSVPSVNSKYDSSICDFSSTNFIACDDWTSSISPFKPLVFDSPGVISLDSLSTDSCWDE